MTQARTSGRLHDVNLACQAALLQLEGECWPKMMDFVVYSKVPRCHNQTQVSNEKRAPGWLGYIRDYTTQLYRDY